MSLQGSLAIDRMCFLVGVSRAGFYRYLRAEDPLQEEMNVRSEVQRIVLEHDGRYGYRRITAELRRLGMALNHKRVAPLRKSDQQQELPQLVERLSELRRETKETEALLNRYKIFESGQND